MLKKILFLALICLFSRLSGQILSGSIVVNSAQNMSLDVTLNTNLNEVILTLKGPNSTWFAYGFDNSIMDGTYALVVDGNGIVDERKLASQSAGFGLNSSIVSTSVSVLGNMRTVVLSRPISATGGNHFNFPIVPSSILLIWAFGSSHNLSNHGINQRGVSMINLANLCNSNIQTLPSSSICLGDSVFFINRYIKSSGFYRDTLSTSIGCDSIIEKFVSVSIPGPHSLPPINICLGDSVLVFGNQVKTTGTYLDTLKNTNNCDSILSQTVNVGNIASHNLTPIDICVGDSALVFGNYTNLPGLYSDTVKRINTCDSLVFVQVNLEILSYSTQYNPGDTIMTVISPGASFQWLENCGNSPIPILGENDSILSNPLSGPGFYSVIISKNGCSDTSDCISYYPSIGLDEKSTFVKYYYPNPVGNELHLHLKPCFHKVNLNLFNAQGQLVKTQFYKSFKEKLHVDLESLPKGSYVIEIKIDSRVEHLKIFKN